MYDRKKISCPYCGKSHYRELLGMTTCIMWYPEYKDGKLVNHNPNSTTLNCECCECGKHFTIESCNGEQKVLK